MKRRNAIGLGIASIAAIACGEAKVSKSTDKPSGTFERNPNRKKLRFNSNKNFKIVQFTDLHINMSKSNFSVVEPLLRETVINQKPDLVVITGDVITEDKPQKGYRALDKVFSELKTQYAIVLGNHDAEKSTSRKEVEAIIESTSDYCLNRTTSEFDGSNYSYEVLGQAGNTESVLYFLDSNSYSTLKPRVEGYGWFTDEQVEWYEDRADYYTKQNNGKVLPALAFFHIPLPEYNEILQDKDRMIGVMKEEVCCPKINTGMFAAMVQKGDVMGTFVGHDHVNDYIGELHDIALAYGRGGGSTNTYGDQIQGARVIVLKEGERSFDSYIYEMGGKIVDECNFPTSFPKPEKKK